MGEGAWTRRELLWGTGGALAGGLLTGGARAAQSPPDRGPEGSPVAAEPEGNGPRGDAGQVTGQATGARAGMEVLAAGGNAVDAAVAAALVAAVVSIHNAGIGGYGGAMVIALPGGRGVTAIDFNTAAPAAARPEMFLDARGQVREGANVYGWLAAGVPGTLAGLQLALERYGTRPLAELLRPAIRLARDGFPVPAPLAGVLRASRARLQRDPATAQLLLPGGEPPAEGAIHRNPELAAMLESLADRGSVDSFYRGDIAQRIAGAFRKHGGLVTAADLAEYRAQEVAPLALEWRGYAVHTAPPTAGGLTVLQALAVLKALGWEREPPADPRAAHARLEALRLAWHDRLRLLGDPEQVEVPTRRLLSEAHAGDLAAQVRGAVRERRPAPAATDGRTADGTVHLSVADGKGMLAALTLTHGAAFGAQVTVEGLGLVLGHGMSRFEPRPGHPNSPAPRKRPLHNMCPTVVLREGIPYAAIGGAGGRKIPNSVFEVVAQLVGRDASLAAAMAAPRLHTEGGLEATLDARAPEAHVDYLKEAGYQVRRAAGANVSAVAVPTAPGRAEALTDVPPSV